MHPNRAIRLALAAAIRAQDIEVTVGGIARPCTVMEHPPSGGWFDDTDLPGIFVYARSERVTPLDMEFEERLTLFDVVVQARGDRDDALDQVDAMQLGVELAIAADRTLGAVAWDARLVGSEVFLNQGEVIFAARRLSIEIKASTPNDDPTFPD